MLAAWDGILILMVLGPGLLLGRVFRALAMGAEASAGALSSCDNVEDGAGAGASAKFGVSLAVAGVVGEVVGVDVVGDFETFFLPILRSSCGLS